MQSITVNSATGEVTASDLSPAEIAAMTPDPAVALAAWRATAKCSRMQGRIALGKERLGVLLAFRNAEETPWVQQEMLDDPADWQRGSQLTVLLGRVLGMSDDEMDDIFQAATQIEA